MSGAIGRLRCLFRCFAQSVGQAKLGRIFHLPFRARQGNSRLADTIEKPLVEGKSAPAYVQSDVDDAVLSYFLWFELDMPSSFGLRRIRRQFQFSF